MTSELIINYRDYLTRVALVENGLLTEIQVERDLSKTNLSGNIYLGRVSKILPGMQAAFIDIGQEKAGFLYVDDVCQQDLSNLFQQQQEDLTENNDDNSSENQLLIEDLLSENQTILIQVRKEPIEQKGARVTSRISLPGRRLVIMPMVDHIGVSRRIEDEAERERLKNILEKIRPANCGFIARTAAEGATTEELQADVDFLQKLWINVALKAKVSSAPSIVHKELNATLRAVRDMFSDQVDRLIIDNEVKFEEIKIFLDSLAIRKNKNIDLYKGKEGIFDYYNLEPDLTRALNKKVWLKSGGYIVIESTEALTVIDVNTGSYVGEHNLEETILKTNLEAVKEIAYQLRLRNIGGLIVIDFIDMNKEENREKICLFFKESLKKDRNKTKVLAMSELGLVEMTRKRSRENFNQQMKESCFYCLGNGNLLSKASIAHQAFLEMESLDLDKADKKIILTTHPLVHEFLLDEERFSIEKLERKLNCQITIKTDETMHLEEYDLKTERF